MGHGRVDGPLLSPYAGQLGVVLASPTRSQITVHGDVEIVLDNPRIRAGRPRPADRGVGRCRTHLAAGGAVLEIEQGDTAGVLPLIAVVTDPAVARTLRVALALRHQLAAFAPARDPPAELAWDDAP